MENESIIKLRELYAQRREIDNQIDELIKRVREEELERDVDP